jgi:hypothetical protein
VTTPFRTLLGLLFPSWTFFDAVRLTPLLQLRRLPAPGAASEWVPALTAPRRRWWHVLFNAAGAQTLAAQTVVEGWARELSDSAYSADGGSSLPLVLAMAEHAVRERGWHTADGAGAWQLRLIVAENDDTSSAHQEGETLLYESDRLPLPGPIDRPRT